MDGFWNSLSRKSFQYFFRLQQNQTSHRNDLQKNRYFFSEYIIYSE